MASFAAADDSATTAAAAPWKRQRTAEPQPQPLNALHPPTMQPTLHATAAGAHVAAFAPGYHIATSNWYAAAGMSWNAMAAPVTVAAAAPALPPSRAEYRQRDQ